MDQLSFAEAEYVGKKRKTRREKFLEQMDGLIPWQRLEALVEPSYPKAGKGRRPYPLSVMLRVHCMQLFYNLSDPAMEDALYEIESMRRFAGLRLAGPLPDETTILNFRHLLEKHDLGKAILESINEYLEKEGLLYREGTIVDASIIAAPTSTKNNSGKRDPEMHQTKKGNQWHFGMKMHIGVDATFGVVHSTTYTAANVHDITQAGNLLHGQETTVHGDAGYLGAHKREELKGRDLEWEIAARPGKRRKMNWIDQLVERMKASTRAVVEHPFHKAKLCFGYKKVRYRGLAKNANRLDTLTAFGNLLTCRKFLPTGHQCVGIPPIGGIWVQNAPFRSSARLVMLILEN